MTFASPRGQAGVFQVLSSIYFLYGVFQLFYNRFIISMYFSSSVSSVSSGVPREPMVSYTHSFLLACLITASYINP